MYKLLQLIKWEYLIQNHINNLTKYLFIFFLFSTFSVTFINNQEDIKKFGIIFSVICLPISLIGLSNLVFTQDLEDGNLELLLSNFTETEIILAKFFSILISALISSVLNMPIIYVIFNLDLQILLHLSITLFLLLILSSALLILTGSIQSYFRSNSNFLTILIMPLLIPSIIMTGLILQNVGNVQLILIMIGINMVFLPILFVLSTYLIKNIYNI